MRRIAGLAKIAPAYDAFLIDQYGVLHDGQRPYAGVPDALAALKRAGKSVVVLTNSGRTAAANEARMAKIGIDLDQIDHTITSGETAVRVINADAKLSRAACYALCSRGDRAILDTLASPVTEDIETAAFILLSGLPHREPARFEDYDPILKAAGARSLLLICANPDRSGLDGTERKPGPGAIAMRYAARGGTVRFIGKPEPEIYQDALARIPDTPVGKVLAIGDSLDTDVPGARRAGLDVMLVGSGLHPDLFEPGAAANQEAALAGVTYLGQSLCW